MSADPVKIKKHRKGDPVRYLLEVGKFGETFQTGKTDVDEAQCFQVDELVSKTFDGCASAIVQIQLGYLKNHNIMHQFQTILN